MSTENTKQTLEETLISIFTSDQKNILAYPIKKDEDITAPEIPDHLIIKMAYAQALLKQSVAEFSELELNQAVNVLTNITVTYKESELRDFVLDPLKKLTAMVILTKK